MAALREPDLRVISAPTEDPPPAPISGMPSIAMVGPSLSILGGQGVQAHALSRELREDGYSVRFIAMDRVFPQGLGWLKRVRVARTLLNFLMYVAALLDVQRADVVHVFSASYWSFLVGPVPAIVLAKLFRKKVVLHYHSGEADDHLSNWGILVHPWLARVDAIVVPSKYLERVFHHHGYETIVVPNVIDVSRFAFKVRRPLRPRLLSLRNLEKLYAVDNTIRAFAILREKYPGASLVIAGYGSDEARLRRLVASLSLRGVTFVGRIEQEDIPALHDAADIFVNSSVIDNQPVSILEAFASGLSVVSTPTGDIASMVREGETGYIAPCGDPRAMATAIDTALTHQHEAVRMATCARLRLQVFTWDHIRPEWARVYGRLVREC